MGEVYRAKDTRLEREVAIKILPDGFAHNEQLLARFQREAKTISSLNHPNICTLHDVGHEGGVHYLVMELIDGESLADRIAKGAIPIDQVMRLGAQIADALDRAHRQGIVHRDLKPGNVMLTKSGAKLLDFGLARSGVDVQPVSGLTDMPTQARPLTAEGTILGTFQYMAPEQLEGVEADARTDIFALGAVLYEAATGRRAFEGTNKTSLIAAIVTGRPAPISSLQPLTPPAFERVVQKCMEKDRDDRWQSAHDVASELRWISEAGSQVGVASPVIARRKRVELATRASLAALAIATLLLAGFLIKSRSTATRALVVDLQPPIDTQYASTGDYAGPAVISPDGETVAFVAWEKGGRRIWVRSLSSGETKPLVGTDDAMFPFWAPDSKRLGFSTGEKLKWIDVQGGATFDICKTGLIRGAAWGAGDRIAVTPDLFDPIYVVPAAGGELKAVTKIDTGRHTTHRWPSFLADGKHFVYLAAKHRDVTRDTGDLYLTSVDGGEPKLLLSGVSNAVSAGDRLLFVREGTLYAQKLASDGTFDGQPARLAGGILYDAGVFRAAISVSDSGRLLYYTGSVNDSRRLIKVDRTGRETGEFGEKALYFDFDLAPDGQKLAISAGDPLREIWVYDLKQKTRTRLTMNATWTGNGIWSPDGTLIYHAEVISDPAAKEQRKSRIVSRRLSDGKAEELFVSEKGFAQSCDVSPDGKELLFSIGGAGGLWKLPLSPKGPPVSLVEPGTDVEVSAHYSPDGRWIAYASKESGRQEVYVVARDNISRKWQVSTAGGGVPVWRPDGKELYFVDTKGPLLAVPVDVHGDELALGSPTELFTPPIGWGWYEPMSSEPTEFLMVVPERQANRPRLTLMTDWTRMLPK